MARLNPHVAVEVHDLRLDAGNAASLVADYDIVADGSDNFATRYAVSDACFRAGKTLVSAAVGEFDGSLTTFKPHLAGADGRPNPTYRCLFPGAAARRACFRLAPRRAFSGALVGVVGSMQALEVMKEIVGIGEGLVGRLLLYDALSARFETIRYTWDPENPLNGAAGAETLRAP